MQGVMVPVPKILTKVQTQAKHDQGTHGFEPWTYRTAADCSTTELYPPYITHVHLCFVATTTLFQYWWTSFGSNIH